MTCWDKRCRVDELIEKRDLANHKLDLDQILPQTDDLNVVENFGWTLTKVSAGDFPWPRNNPRPTGRRQELAEMPKRVEGSGSLYPIAAAIPAAEMVQQCLLSGLVRLAEVSNPKADQRP